MSRCGLDIPAIFQLTLRWSPESEPGGEWVVAERYVCKQKIFRQYRREAALGMAAAGFNQLNWIVPLVTVLLLCVICRGQLGRRFTEFWDALVRSRKRRTGDERRKAPAEPPSVERDRQEANQSDPRFAAGCHRCGWMHRSVELTPRKLLESLPGVGCDENHTPLFRIVTSG